MQRYEDIKELVQDLEKIHVDVRSGLPLDEMIEKISHALALYDHFRKDFLGNTLQVQTVRSVGSEIVLGDFDLKSLE